VLLHGPAASGKTAAALETYRSFTDEAGRSGCLLLVPNAPTAARLRRVLVGTAPRGLLVAPGVLTFAALAGRILAAASESETPRPTAVPRAISALERNLLLGRIVDELHAAGRLSALGAVADTPGLVRTLDAAIAELKRAAIDPRRLADVISAKSGKSHDLLEVYRCYQDELGRSNRWDVEGQMWLARDRLSAARAAGGRPPGLDDVRAIVVDGFTDFTPTQLEILTLLSGNLERLVIALCWGDDPRQRMWHWAGRTRRNIHSAFGAGLTEIDTRRRRDLAPQDLGRLWRKVFDFDAPACEASGGLHVIAAAGIDAEVAAVARRVKRLLLDGSPAGSIAVTARSMDVYRPAIERIFAEHDIPLSPAPVALTDSPIVRFLLDAASLAPTFDSRHVLRVIKNSYFRPQALGQFDESVTATAEMLIREGNVLQGRAAYADAAARVAARIARRDEDAEPVYLGPIEATPETLTDAADMLDELFDLCQADAGGASGALARLIDALQLHQGACDHDEPRLIARDLRALSAMSGALSAVHEPTTLQRLGTALACVACPPRRPESLVDCPDVLDARALRYDHVFCLGMTEGQFPLRLGEGALIGEADRQAWAEGGVVLDSRTDLAAREMFLFYLTASRADKTLTLAYQEADTAGSAAAPSSFLLSLVAPLGGLEAVRVERIGPGQPVPASDQLATGRDALNAALAGLFHRDLCESPAPLAWAADRAAEKVARAAAGLWARHRRWKPDTCDQFDGRLSDRRLLDVLADRYPDRVVFSATRLNTYGQCPWQYFATYVLKLAPLGEPQRRLEPTARGLFVHNVLQRLMTDLRGSLGGPVRLAEIGEGDLSSALDRAMAAESADVESACPPPYPVLWKIQRAQLRRDIEQYLGACREPDELQAESLHFELGFGIEGRGDEPASTLEPVSLPVGLPEIGAVRMRGRIDRVDRVRYEGREGLLVVDYKTGWLPKQADIIAGRSLQLPIYAAAAEVLLGSDALGGVFHRVWAQGAWRQYFAAMTLSRGTYKDLEDYDQKREAVFETIGRFVQGMRAGRFDVLPTDKCPSYCPFRQICHYSGARERLKRPVGPEQEAPE